MTTTVYDLLRQRCGLSQEDAALFHNVRIDTIRSWCGDRRPAPPGPIAELKGLYRDIIKAGEILAAGARLLPQIDADGNRFYWLGLPLDEQDARGACGWPCSSACEAAVAVAIAALEDTVRLVPRVRGGIPTALMPNHERAPARSRSPKDPFGEYHELDESQKREPPRRR
jgi:hypothetical protein